MDNFICNSFSRTLCNFEQQRGECIMNNRGAAMEKETIVKLIVIFVCFAVILVFIWMLWGNTGAQGKEEACRQSIALASKGGKSFLSCSTSFVCISGGKNCASSVSKYDEVIKVNPEEKSEILKAIAVQMQDCWWMFAEGQQDYLSFWQIVSTRCGICSSIRFDEEIQTKSKPISYGDLYQYLLTTYPKSGVNYLNYLYGLPPQLTVSELLSTDWEKYGLKAGKMDFSSKLDLAQSYSVITGENGNNVGANFYVSPFFIKSDEVRTITQCDSFDLTNN